MLRAEIKKEVIITNEELANYLFQDGRLMDYMSELFEVMLYDGYNMDYEDRHNAVYEGLRPTDYAFILRNLADRMEE